MGKNGCGKCYCEDGEVEKGRHWNVQVFLGYVCKMACFPLEFQERNKTKTSSPATKLLVAHILYKFTLKLSVLEVG